MVASAMFGVPTSTLRCYLPSKTTSRERGKNGVFISFIQHESLAPLRNPKSLKIKI
jgi:hypothetical protein